MVRFLPLSIAAGPTSSRAHWQPNGLLRTLAAFVLVCVKSPGRQAFQAKISYNAPPGILLRQWAWSPEIVSKLGSMTLSKRHKLRRCP